MNYWTERIMVTGNEPTMDDWAAQDAEYAASCEAEKLATEDGQAYALERGGCWHAVTPLDAGRWESVCGLTGQPYRGQPSSITYLTSPPSPLCCPHPPADLEAD